jgi:hypothetical protein
MHEDYFEKVIEFTIILATRPFIFSTHKKELVVLYFSKKKGESYASTKNSAQIQVHTQTKDSIKVENTSEI